jgi:two-component system CheB/CheR fusion protein
MIAFSDVSAGKLPEPLPRRRGKQITFNTDHEIELQRTLEELQNTREEMQTSQEELKSSNEELQSTNEELQSTNEEMQSLNEELQTVNIELQSKISDFMVANNDMKNLLNSTDIATLFLDKELNIRRYTEELTKIIKLRPSDIGRPFTEMVSDLQYPRITDDAKEVLHTLIFKETDTTTHDQKWFKVRIMPYRTSDDKIEGLVITFIEITVAKKLEEELKKTIGILREHNLYRP